MLHVVGVGGPWPALGGLSALTLHVAAAIIALPLLVVHTWGARQRLTGTDLSRRSLLRTAAFGLGAAALWTVAEGALRLTGSPGARRRATGSHELGTGDPAAMPVTQWFTDTVPETPPDSIELVVGSRRRRIPVAELDRGDRVRAVLDCTGGWYAEQDWAGIRLDHLLAELADATCPRTAASTSSRQTGFRRRLPLRDAGSLLLATLPAGSRCRRATARRSGWWRPAGAGFWWVKWVRRVEVVDAPWWVQPPFPLQ